MPKQKGLSHVEVTGIRQAQRLIDIAEQMSYEEVERFNRLLIAMTEEIQKFVDQGVVRVVKH